MKKQNKGRVENAGTSKDRPSLVKGSRQLAVGSAASLVDVGGLSTRLYFRRCMLAKPLKAAH